MCGIVISGSSAFVRENLSPFTKDFRAEDHTMSVYSFFGIPSKERDQKLELEKNVKTMALDRALRDNVIDVSKINGAAPERFLGRAKEISWF